MSTRIEKVRGLLSRELSALVNESLPDNMELITIVNLNVTADFKNANIYISCLQNKKIDGALKALERKTNEFQRIIGKKFKMRYTPKLHFFAENSNYKVQRVDELLKKINNDL